MKELGYQPKYLKQKENKTSQTRKTDLARSKNSPVHKILFLQKTIGNQLVQRLIKSGALQAKLMLGQPGDKYEQEADSVAEQVMRMPAPKVQLQSENKEVSSRTSDIEAQFNSIRGGGQPIPESVRAFFELRFDRDFSQVRVHTDARAAESAQAVNAQAYTVGRDIVFGAGRYTPDTLTGKRLIAHELTHVMQQGLQPQYLQAQGPVSQGSALEQARAVAQKYGLPEKLIPKETIGWGFDSDSGNFTLTLKKEVIKELGEGKKIALKPKIAGTIKHGTIEFKEGFSATKPWAPWVSITKVEVSGPNLVFHHLRGPTILSIEEFNKL